MTEHARADRIPPVYGKRSEQLDLEIELLNPTDRAVDPDRRGRSGRAPTVLVVDDDADMRRYVRRSLAPVGIPRDSVSEACSAERALEALRARSVDLVVTDIVLPGVDGLELVRAMRNRPGLRAVPVLVITGEASPRDARERVRGAGAQAVLLKPFNARSLGQVVQRLLGPRLPPTTTGH